MTVTYSIGMLSRLSGTSIETIRYYEKVALLPAPSRASNGFREYDNTFVGCLAFIRHGRELGFTFDEIRELLKIARYAEEPWVDADRMTRDHLDALRSEIRKLQRLWRGLKQEADCYSRKSKLTNSFTRSRCRTLGADRNHDTNLSDRPIHQDRDGS